MNLLKSMAITFTSRGMNIAIGFATTFLLARWADKEVLGSYFLVDATLATLITFFCMGIEVASIREMAISKVDEKRNIVGSVLLFYGIAMAIAFPFFLIVPSFTGWDGQLASPLFLLFGGMFLFELSVAMVQGAELFKVYAVANILNSLIFLILILLGAESGIGFSTIVLFRSTSCLLSGGFALFFLVRMYRPTFWNSWTVIRRLFRFGWAVWLNNLQSIVFLRLDIFLVSYFLGSANVATLEMARRIPMALRSLFQSLRAVLFPRLSALYADGQEEGASRLVRRMALVTMGVFSVMAILSWLFAREIIVIVFSERYLEAIAPFALLMTSLIFALGSNVLGTAVMCSGDSLSPTLVNTITAVINVGLNVALIPHLGVAGAALAALVAAAVSLPLNFFALQRGQVSHKASKIAGQKAVEPI